MADSAQATPPFIPADRAAARATRRRKKQAGKRHVWVLKQQNALPTVVGEEVPSTAFAVAIPTATATVPVVSSTASPLSEEKTAAATEVNSADVVTLSSTAQALQQLQRATPEVQADAEQGFSEWEDAADTASFADVDDFADEEDNAGVLPGQIDIASDDEAEFDLCGVKLKK
jgi:hypothetical protein